MEILMIIFGVLAIIGMIAFFIHLFVIAYKKEQQEQDERILQLEKRLEEYKKEWKETELRHIEYLNKKIDNKTEDINKLEMKIKKLERKKKSDKE